MTELRLAAINESEQSSDTDVQKSRGKFDKAWRLAHRSRLHRQDMQGVLHVRTTEELAALEAADDTELAAAAKHDAAFRQCFGESHITPHYQDDMADQFGAPDPPYQPTRQESATQ